MDANSTEPVILEAEKQIPVPKRKSSRKRSITIFTIVTLLNVAVLAFLWTQLLTPAQTTTQGSSQTNTNDPMIEHPAPNFTLEAHNLTQDAPISLTSFKGKPILMTV